MKEKKNSEETIEKQLVPFRWSTKQYILIYGVCVWLGRRRRRRYLVQYETCKFNFTISHHRRPYQSI